MFSQIKQIYDPDDAIRRTHSALCKYARQNRYVPYGAWIPRLELNYTGRKMRSEYADEQISYFTKEGLEKIQVMVIDNHVQTMDGNPYNTDSEQMVVMDKHGNIFTYPKKRGVIHHSSFFSGDDLSFAGLWQVASGRITHNFGLT